MTFVVPLSAIFTYFSLVQRVAPHKKGRKLTKLQSNFLVTALQISNDVPVNVQSSQSVPVLKSTLKTFLFNCASV